MEFKIHQEFQFRTEAEGKTFAKLRLPGLPMDGAEAEDALLTSAPSHREIFAPFPKEAPKARNQPFCHDLFSILS